MRDGGQNVGAVAATVSIEGGLGRYECRFVSTGSQGERGEFGLRRTTPGTIPGRLGKCFTGGRILPLET